MRVLILAAMLIATAPSFSQEQTFTIGAIDFYGLAASEVERVRAALPLRIGDEVSFEKKEKIIALVSPAIKAATGRELADLAPVCCDQRGRLLIYIGLRDESVRQTAYNTEPRGSARLPAIAIKKHRDAGEALSVAMSKGVSGEDDSKGYALSIDPEARAKQLVLHAYATRHARSIRHVLTTSRDVEQRQIAAEMLGYAGRSNEQIRALIRASYDVDSGVRNNAIRALAVLAKSSSDAAAIIPGECFVDLLNSVIWTDRNKSLALLAALTKKRDARLLACVRERALTSLIEMARWSNRGHADNARLMLGRIAGIDEKTLSSMLDKQEIEPIIASLKPAADSAKRDCPRCAALK